MQVFFFSTQTNVGDYMKQKLKDINQRLTILEWILFAIFLLLIYFLIRTIYFQKEFYENKLVELTDVIVYGDSAPRGRIYDRNYNLLVDNIAVPIIYYQKKEDITPEEEIELAYSVVDQLELEYEKLSIRNLKEFYLAIYPEECDAKITEEEWDKLKQRKLTISDIENLKISRITEEDLQIFSERDKKTA